MTFLEKHPELIRLADPRNGVTPLHKAAAFLLQPMAAWLLDRGADANALNRIGNTPLDVVGCARNFGTPQQVAAITELLLGRGAERTARWALTTGNAEWLRARHSEGTLGQPIYGDEGLLSLAVRYDHPEMLALLLDLGFDPDERRQVGWNRPIVHVGPAASSLRGIRQTGNGEVAARARRRSKRAYARRRHGGFAPHTAKRIRR